MAEDLRGLVHGPVHVANEAEPAGKTDGGETRNPIPYRASSLCRPWLSYFVISFISRYPCGAIPNASATRLKKANIAVMYTASAICGSVQP